jgi:ubiquinone/menaquinone biosynthesis C-methylase UbiE
MEDPYCLVDRLDIIQNKIFSGEYSNHDLNEANQIAEQLLFLTKISYDAISGKYAEIRGNKPQQVEINDWNKLLNLAREKAKLGLLGDNNGNLNLLDIGTGSGRDIKYASKIADIRVIGIDNSDGFIELLHQLEMKKEIPTGSYFKADMRNLSHFSEGYFDIVRNNASLVHLPLIKKGYMADLAISESFRVLKNNGILYLLVREGDGLELIDTEEGLGVRFYQLFTKKKLLDLVTRNGFKNIELWTRPSSRNKEVMWIALMAEKIIM